LVFESASFQDAFCATPDAVPALVALYDGCTSRRLLVAVTRAVCSAVRHNTAAQTSFINAGVAPFISAIIALKVSSFSLYIVDAEKACNIPIPIRSFPFPIPFP